MPHEPQTLLSSPVAAQQRVGEVAGCDSRLTEGASPPQHAPSVAGLSPVATSPVCASRTVEDTGRVRLVGAGPGAVDLLTLRAAKAIGEAEALLYDALVDPEVLELAPTACLRIQTGKRAGRTSMSQDTINRLMLRLARRGLKVVRLKGGDPSVFGRVGEEKAFLEAHGVSVDIVPGVTAASAAAAQFGFPLTHRGAARRLVLATASLDDGRLSGDWSAAADKQATAAIYMGRDKASAVCAELIRLGRPAGTPAVAVENAGRDTARKIAGTLETLPRLLAAQAPNGPVILLIGEAMGLALTALEAAAA